MDRVPRERFLPNVVIIVIRIFACRDENGHCDQLVINIVSIITRLKTPWHSISWS